MMMHEETQAAKEALRRLMVLAYGDSGASQAAANFLLGWWNAKTCGGFDLTDMWSCDQGVRADMISVMRLVADREKYPDAYFLRQHWVELVELWRPHLVAKTRQRSRKVGAIEDLPESVADEIEELGEDGRSNNPGSI